MLNVQTLGILLRALRDGNTRPDAPRAPVAVGGVARVPAVAADPNESLRGDAAVRVLPALLRAPSTLTSADRDTPFDGAPSARADSPIDARTAPQERVFSRGEARTGAQEARVASRGANPADAGGTRIAPSAEARAQPSASAALEISATGRWLTGVPHHASDTAPAAARATPPLVAEAAVRAPALAAAFERALTTTGVFYEAHLARWIADDFTLAQLAREPQAAWTATMPDPASVSAPAMPEDAEKLAIVGRQLEALDTRTIVWSGLPWPGQHASIEIGEDERRSQSDDGHGASAQSSWRTRITMTLPALGTVEAVLALRGDALEVRLVASEAARARLALAHDELRGALAARSLELAAFSTGSADGR